MHYEAGISDGRGDGVANSASCVVILYGNQTAAGGARRGEQRVTVDRRYRVQIHDSNRRAGFLELLIRGERLENRHTCTYDRRGILRTLTENFRAADLERLVIRIDHFRLGATGSQV